MKKLYEMPAIELTKFDVEDVITASTGEIADLEAFKTAAGLDAIATWNSEWDKALGI